MNQTRRLIAAALVALASAGTLAAADARTRRQEESAAAAKEFRNTHNYAQHRGLAVVPGIYELVDILGKPPVRPIHRRLLEDAFGITMDEGRPVGLFTVQEEGFKLGAFGCVACHSSRVAGQTVIGAGNKAIDVGTIGRTIGRFRAPYRWSRPLRAAPHNEVVDRAFAFADKLVHPRITNMTRGVVSMNHVNLWFYEMAGVTIPATVPRAGTKVPPLWGIKAKAVTEGLFYDGLGGKGSIAWLALPELTAGQTAANIRADYARIEKLWDNVAKLLPPKYPFPIKHELVDRGRAVYAESCQKCHGTYQRDSHGDPMFQPPLFNTEAEIGTDPDRLDGSTAELKQLIAKSPLSDLVTAADRPRGWFATRLEGVWTNFPYLHNGSVPTLRDLLEKPEKRPRFWSLERVGERDRFDAERVGYTLPAPGSFEAKKLETFGKRGARDVYDTGREGHSSRGHDFGTELPEADKVALIEYLKTL